MGWIGCVRCEKFRRNFMARTFALVRNVSPRFSKGNLTILNAPKWYKMQQNKSLGSNGVDWVRSLRKIPTRLRGTNFCTSSECFAPSLVRKPSGLKWYETHQNVSLGSNGVDRVRLSRKTSRTFVLVRNVWPLVPFGNFTIPNATKWYETHQNMSLASNGVDWVRSSRKKCDSTSWHELLH